MLTDKELEEIRRKLQAMEEEPPVMAWKQIKQEIQPARRPRLFWWLVPLALLLLTGTGIWLGYTHKNTQPVPATSTAPTHPQSADNPVISPRVKATVPPVTVPNTVPNTSSTRGRAGASLATKPVPNRQNQPNPRKTNSQNKRVEQQEKTSRSLAKGITAPTKKFVPAPAAENKITVAGSNKQTPLAPGGGNSQLAADSTQTKNADQPLPPPVAPVNNQAAAGAPSRAADTLNPQPVLKPRREKVPRTPESWTLGLAFSPRYGFRKIMANRQDEILITRLKEADKLNNARLGYEFGVQVSKAISRPLYLEAGISVLALKENIAYTYTTGKMDTISQTTFAPDGSVTVRTNFVQEDRELQSAYRYGGLRLGLTYYFAQNSQSRFNLTAAAGANLLLKGHTKQYSNGQWTETTYFPSPKNMLEQSNYNLLLGLGYNTHLWQNFEMMVMPSLNYFLGSTYLAREPIGLRPYSLGLTLQVKRIGLKRNNLK